MQLTDDDELIIEQILLRREDSQEWIELDKDYPIYKLIGKRCRKNMNTILQRNKKRINVQEWIKICTKNRQRGHKPQ